MVTQFETVNLTDSKNKIVKIFYSVNLKDQKSK